MNEDEYEFINGGFPLWMVGVQYKYHKDLILREGCGARKIQHQTAGHACHHHYIYGFIFQPNPQFAELGAELNERYLGSETTMPAKLDQIIKYRSILQKYGLDCNSSYMDFEEAIYPIDIEFLKTVSSFRENKLNKLVVMKSSKCDDKKLQKAFELLFQRSHWELFILGENCD